MDTHTDNKNNGLNAQNSLLKNRTAENLYGCNWEGCVYQTASIISLVVHNKGHTRGKRTHHRTSDG
jgi:hypothetical protein